MNELMAVRPPAGRESVHLGSEPAVEVRSLWADYDGRPALRDVSLSLEAGARCAVVGPNGAGKSTLFRAIAGLHRPSRGEVRVYGSPPGRHVCIAYIEQHGEVNWRFPATVEDVVAMGRVARAGYLKVLGRRDRRVVTDALERVSLVPLRRRRIGELSGGERRRMFVARALAQEAEIMLLDEPLAGLDNEAREQVAETLRQLADDVTILVATHDLGLAEQMQQVLLLNRAAIAVGPPGEVLLADRLQRAYGDNLRRTDARGVSYALPDTHCDHGHHPPPDQTTPRQ